MSVGRSENMRRIRSKNTRPELAVRKIIRGLGFTGYRLHRKELPGKPDVAFISRKKAVMIHGCFWHGHDCKEGARKPKSRADYWIPKIEGNRRRDLRHQKEMADAGWELLTVWECEIKNEASLLEKLAHFLRYKNSN